MLLTKRHRLQILERKAETEGREPPVGLVGKLGSLWGASGDEAEVRALRLEVSGLETMQASLSAGLGTLLSRRAEKARAATLTGRMLAVPRMCFSVYCVYRVLATLLTTLRRVLLTSVPGSPPPDPVTRFLSLLTAHYDPTLDEAALARQISFLLSGVILLLSLSSLNQTVRLLSRAAPSLLRLARANLPLLPLPHPRHLRLLLRPPPPQQPPLGRPGRGGRRTADGAGARVRGGLVPGLVPRRLRGDGGGDFCWGEDRGG